MYICCSRPTMLPQIKIGDRVVKQCKTCVHVTCTRLISCLCLFDTSSFLLEIGIAIKAQYKKQYGRWPFIHMCILRNEIIFKVTEMCVASCSVQCTILSSIRSFSKYILLLSAGHQKNGTGHAICQSTESGGKPFFKFTFLKLHIINFIFVYKNNYNQKSKITVNLERFWKKSWNKVLFSVINEFFFFNQYISK